MFVAARKDAERAEARRLRAEGLSVKKIAARVGVSVASVSVWVRDVPTPPKPPKPPKRPANLGRPRTPTVPDDGGPRRRCGRCHAELPLSAFNRAGDGRQHWCRDCFSDYFRERGDRHREQSRAARRRRRDVARDFIREYLATHPCVDCGEDDLLVLEFDHHRGEKTAEIARLLGDARLARVREEIERCEVVCVNCHRRRTEGRAGTYRATGIPARSWDKYQRRNLEYLVERLRRGGCVDCGERDPMVLDFDHRGEKRMNVPRLALGCSLEALDAEIAVCEIRCANCHRLRTLAGAPCWRAEDHWARYLHESDDEVPPEGLEPSPMD